MSGKSTFLRAVGLNMVLALNGLPVCAKTFSCSPLSIATCIRISDSLEENQSYFRAEIKKLSQIMKLLEPGRPILCCWMRYFADKFYRQANRYALILSTISEPQLRCVARNARSGNWKLSEGSTRSFPEL